MNKNKDLTTFELDFYQQEGYLVRESMFNEVELLKINSAFERSVIQLKPASIGLVDISISFP